MRWQQQKIDDDAALVPIKGLIRSVRPPEFEGVTFHEVLCKSALNKVPGQSNMPFAWTVNPTRGCLHRCVYCLSPETLILMADGRQRPIRDIRPGDRIIGTEFDGKYRRFIETTVHAAWSTRKRAHRVTLRDGTEIVASGDHRFLTARGWKYVRPAQLGEGQRPYLTTQNSLMGFGLGMPADVAERGTALVGRAVKTSSDLGVVSIDDLGEEQEMVDITTGTGDFIANGVISHNCFARKTHEYLDLNAGRDFDTQIVVKTNIAEVLRAELARPSWRREHVALGTNSDPYMRAEGRYQLMPGIIGALADSGTPFSILTKGPLLKRDLPLLAETPVPVEVGVSLAFADDDLQQSVEPGTPRPAARLALIRSIAEAGLDCTVLAMPVLPWLTDSVEHLDELFAGIKAAGARWVSAGALHLRPGAREWFLAWLRREHPALLPRYLDLYGRGAYAPKDYREWLGARVDHLRRRHGFVRPTGVAAQEDRWQRSPAQQAPMPATPSATQPALF